MNDDRKQDSLSSKRLVRLRITESQPAWNKPCFLYLASITGSLAGQGTAIIRNGYNDEAEKVFDLIVPTASMKHGRFQPPLYFSKGIFVEIGSNVTSVLVHFLPER